MSLFCFPRPSHALDCKKNQNAFRSQYDPVEGGGGQGGGRDGPQQGTQAEMDSQLLRKVIVLFSLK